MTHEKIEFHDVAKIFPMMKTEEFDDLKEDIKKNGLLEPIWLYESKIIDGRNRYRACNELNIEPQYREYEPENGVDPVDFVVSMNLIRRHLASSQKAMAAVAAMPFYEKRAKIRKKSTLNNVELDREIIPPQEKGRARDVVGKIFGVSGKYVSYAKAIIDFSPDLAEKVRKGALSIPKALTYMKRVQQVDRLANVAKTYDPDSAIQLVHADFYDYCKENLDKNSVDLIVTDPPYKKDDLPLYDKLGEVAKRVLKPGGFLVVYTGQYFLPEVIKKLCKYLQYLWIYCLCFKRNGRNYPDKFVINRWKPVLIFYKGSDCRAPKSSVDFIANSGRQKEYDEWQQNIDGFKHLIDAFSKPGDLVLDPMVGSGTSMVVCRELKRKAIGIDIDEKVIELCKGRLSESTAVNKS